MKVLVTGGAGFIGSRVAVDLIARGIEVVLLDNLSDQVHGEKASFPENLENRTACVKGDVRDSSLIKELIPDCSVIVHLAAETGTGQSMYDVSHYSDVNIQGTANLLNALVNSKPTSVKKIVVASSRAIYGEGKYECAEHGGVYPSGRSVDRLENGEFEPLCPVCEGAIRVAPTTEDSPTNPSSFYGLTKYVQENMVLMFARALNIDAYALRYQNVYGPGQSLSNPYTGILAVFSNLAKGGKSLQVFEDGKESRDFVYVQDVVDATVSAILSKSPGQHAINIGSGVRTSVIELAERVREFYGCEAEMKITGQFRVGDIRHNQADLRLAKKILGYEPRVEFEEGIIEFLKWANDESLQESGFDESLDELHKKGFLLGGKK